MRRYFKQEWKGIVLFTALLILSRLALIQIARYKGSIIDAAMGSKEIDITSQIVLFLLLILLNIGVGYLFSLLRYRTIQRILRQMREDIFQKTLSQSRASIRNLDRAQLINKYTTELGIVESNYLDIGGRVIEHFFVLLLSLAAMLLIDIQITLLAVVIYMAPIVATKSQQKKLSLAQKSYLEDAKTHVGKFMSYLKSLELIKNYHIEQPVSRVYDSSLESLKDSALKRARVQANTNGLSMSLTFFAQGIIALFCVYQVYHGRLSVGGFVTIFSLSSTLSGPIYWLARLVEAVISSRPAVRSVLDYIQEPTETPPLAQTRGSALLEITDMDFAYDNTKILKQLALRVEANKKILIIGKSGSGKSTLMSLIMGYLLPQEGRIAYGAEQLEDLLCLSSQDSFLFEDSLDENLFCADADARRRMLARLGLQGITERQSGGLDLTEKGKNVSGGQKKRIALCRSFLQKTPLLILDEPLANIDPENIHLIEQAIADIKDRSLILISHQISDQLLQAMDEIYLLENAALHSISRDTAKSYQGGAA